MPAVVQDSHVGLGICRDDAGVSLLAAMPTKFGEFLAAGRPVVVNAGLVDAAEMVRRTGAGVVHDPPGDPRRTVDALLDVLDDPATGERCRTLALDHFNLETGVARLAEIYRSVSATV
jgi:glycosyltransferase involved in cell wall biosynthesis